MSGKVDVMGSLGSSTTTNARSRRPLAMHDTDIGTAPTGASYLIAFKV